MNPAIRSALLAAAAVASLFPPLAHADYALARSLPIAGEGGWDYLTYDAPSNRLFVTRASRVQVVDPETATVLADIADTAGVHGVALAGDLGKGYTSNGRDNSVTVFDLKSLAILRKIGTIGGENPDFIAYDPSSKRIATFNGRSHNASFIDATTDRLVATLALRGKPEAAVADGTGAMFVNIEDRNEITAIDVRTASVVATWPLPGCEEPAGLAIDARTRRLFVGCHNRTLLVVDADAGRIVASLPIGEGVDATAFDAQTRQIFSSQGDGTLTIIDEESPERFVVRQIAATRPGARTMAINPVNHDVYLVSAEFEEAPAEAGQPRPRRTIKPGSFTLLVMRARP